MGRLACVNFSAFSTQILLRRQPEWRLKPVVVVSEAKPQARIVEVNVTAAQLNIDVGMTYAEALAISEDLYAGVVSSCEIDAAVLELYRQLIRYSPQVEFSKEEPGIFWLDASGLGQLYESLHSWAQQFFRDLHKAGWRCSVSVGFSKFGSYALAKTRRQIAVLADADQERLALRQIQLQRLGLDIELLNRLTKLGINTVAEFLALPAADVLNRFGERAWQFHRLASGQTFSILRAHECMPIAQQKIYCDDPEDNLERVVFILKRLLHPLTVDLQSRQESIRELILVLRLNDGSLLRECLKPAQPTLDLVILLDLLRLRLAALDLSGGLIEIDLAAEGEPISPVNGNLLPVQPRRDLDAGLRALARVRAEFGESAVLQASLQAGHLPEAQANWTPYRQWREPRPRLVMQKPLIRRLRSQAKAMQRHPFGYPASESKSRWRHWGSYLLNGGWWRREVRRQYYYVPNHDGSLAWLFYDQLRQRWFDHGRVE